MKKLEREVPLVDETAGPIEYNGLFVDEKKGEQLLASLTDELLESQDLPELYVIINNYLDAQKGTVKGIIDNVRFKKALVVSWIDALKRFNEADKTDYKKVNSHVMGAEAYFIELLKGLGVKVDVDSELDAENLKKKPHLFMATHQGGGLETYVLAEMMRQAGVDDYRYVMKDELVDMPVVGKVISGRKPILVKRKNLKTEEGKEQEILRLAQEIVETMSRGENVLFFFEGTRSKNGWIAHTEKRQEWSKKLTAAIDAEAKRNPDLDYAKALVVLDMLSVLPVAIEKKLIAPIRTNGDCTIKIVEADGLRVEDNKENLFDEETLFGKARSNLKSTLIARIKRYQKEAKLV